MSESEVSEFVSRYRELSGDLARLQTATRQEANAGRGQQIDSVFYLSRLVAGGHNLLYRDRRWGLAQVWDYMTIAVPREIRRSWLPISIAALFMFGPAVIAYEAVVRDPTVESQLIPQGMLERAEAGVVRAKRREGYIVIGPDERPLMASFIITNNVQVTTAAFAGGMTAGLGTLVALVYNGVSLGSVLGLYQNKGILHLILEFVAPHGVLELTAITFGGGGGLLLGSAFLLPGAMTRREALVVRGQRALRLLAASVLLLLVAGTLEGLVSPIPTWTLAQKLSVSAVTAVLLALYVSLGRGRRPPAETLHGVVPPPGSRVPFAGQLGAALILLAGIPALHFRGPHGVAWGQGPIIERLIPFDARRRQLTLDYIHQHYDSTISTVRIAPRMIVVHWTDTPSVDSTLRLFTPDDLPASRPDIARGGVLNVSAHYLVDRDGTILSLVSDTVMARHTIGLNLIAIGIENVGGGASGPLTDRQLDADRWLILYLVGRYPAIRYLIGHCEYGRFRHTSLWEERDSTYITPKTDPGAEFMARLRRSVGRPDLAERADGR
jgi:uncharacterized membrane protein SpoIIM required for sporulation